MGNFLQMNVFIVILSVYKLCEPLFAQYLHIRAEHTHCRRPKTAAMYAVNVCLYGASEQSVYIFRERFSVIVMLCLCDRDIGVSTAVNVIERTVLKEAHAHGTRNIE